MPMRHILGHKLYSELAIAADNAPNTASDMAAALKESIMEDVDDDVFTGASASMTGGQ